MDLAGLINVLNSEKTGNIETQKDIQYVIYVRKSTDNEEKQVRSIDDQITECKEYAQRIGLIVASKPIIEMQSAKQPDTRPAFRQMMEDLKRGKYGGVIAWHPDRLSRNMKDAGEIIDLVDKGVIRDLKFASFTFENTTSGKMLLGITFVLSKQYSDNLSDNVLRGNKRSVEEGKYINRTKHGYYKDANQFLRPDDFNNNFNLIKKAFQMRLAGVTQEKIAQYLNENNYSKDNTGEKRKIIRMTKQLVSSFLSDPIYAGVLQYGDNDAVYLKDQYEFEPMVTVEEFFQINKGEKKYSKVGHVSRKKDIVQADLMRGRVLCGYCKEPLSAGITTKKTLSGPIRYFYFRCETRGCRAQNTSVRANVIIKYAVDFLNEKPFSSKTSYEHYKTEMSKISAEKVHEAKSQLATLQSKRTASMLRQNKLKEAIIDETDGRIKNEFRQDFENNKNKLISIDEGISILKQTISGTKLAIATYEEFLELIEKVPYIIEQSTQLEEINFYMQKIFSNFTVKGKKVINIKLAEPFNKLCDPQNLKSPNLLPDKDSNLN